MCIRDSTGTDAPGGSGGSGIIILRYATPLFTTFTGVTTATYRQASSISVTTTVPAKVTFLANGKRIAGCISILTNNLVATCSWRPSVRGSVTVTAVTVPTNSALSQTTDRAVTFIGKRTGTR